MNSTISILIVDDNKAARDSLDMLLSSEGYDLHFVEDGRTAIEYVRKHHPDLVLLDIMMPEFDGYEVCRRIRMEPNIREVPVVLITALDDRESKMRGIRAGADDFISKPFDRAELRLKIRNITALNRFRTITNARGRFKWLADLSDDAAVVLNASDRILYANEAARVFFSLPDSEDLAGIRFLEAAQKMFTPEPAHLWKGWPGNLIPPDGEVRYLIRPEKEHIKSLWLDVSILEQHDEETIYIVTMKNVTRQVQNWRDGHLLQNAIAHKLRTPLSEIAGSIDLLTSATKEGDGHSPALAAMSTEGIVELKDAISEILAFTDARQLLLKEPKSSISRAVDIAAEIAAEIGIESLLISCDDTIKAATLNISEDATRHILRELLGNSQKFHPDRQAVVRINLDITEQGSAVMTISDDGVTIAPEELRHVWDPFYQSEASYQANAAGLGLGLAFVRTLILSVGGRCTISNHANGNGIAVTLHIPLV